MVVEEKLSAELWGASEPEVARALSELKRRFATGGGCIARVGVFEELLPTLEPQSVEEALHRLREAGAAEMHCLADGTLAFQFRPG